MKFETGKTYSTRSACDHDCIFSFAVIRRTPKTIAFFQMRGGRVIDSTETVRGVKIDEAGNEFCFPLGQYSMAPVIRAERAEA